MSFFGSLLCQRILLASSVLGNAWGEANMDDITVKTRTELVKVVNHAKPGTVVRIAPGQYTGGLRFEGLRGEVDKPIVLTAADPRNPPEFLGGSSGFQLLRPQHVELRNLIIRDAEGNGINIDDGGVVEKPAHHIVLSGIQIRDIGPRGNRDGIKLSGVDDFLVADCKLSRWGESGSAIDMVGCHSGEIKNCEFRYRVDLFANGVQTKGGSSGIRIHHCRFENAGGRALNIGGSTGKSYFRPRSPGYEAKNIIVEDCTIIGSLSPIVFVGVDGAVVQYNTIYRPRRWIIRILQESRGDEFVPCRNGKFSNNLVVFQSAQVRQVVNVGGGTAPETFKFEGNHWYCQDQPARSSRLGLPVKENQAVHGVAPQFRDEKSGDLRLKKGSGVLRAGVRPLTQQP